MRVLAALLAIATLAACGADGEPEQPTRAASPDLLYTEVRP